MLKRIAKSHIVDLGILIFNPLQKQKQTLTLQATDCLQLDLTFSREWPGEWIYFEWAPKLAEFYWEIIITWGFWIIFSIRDYEKELWAKKPIVRLTQF